MTVFCTIKFQYKQLIISLAWFFTSLALKPLHRLGEIRDRGLENQSYRASGLTLLTAAISLWNTVYIERAIDSLRRKGIPINEQLITHLSPLGWEHINLSGDYVWRTNLKLGQGKYRALRSVNSNLYKKQA